VDPITSYADLVTLLRRQHDQARSTLPQVLARQGHERRDLFAHACQLLAVHEALEQLLIRPYAASEADAAEARDRIAEERQAEDAVTALETLPLDSDEFEHGYAAFVADVERHAHAEEVLEFPSLPDGELTDLQQRQVRLARELVTPGAGLLGTRFAEMSRAAHQRLQSPSTTSTEE